MSTTTARRAADHDGRGITVSADDGTPIAVRTFGPADPHLTVVFVHGHCLRAECWSFLRDQLLRHWGMVVGGADGVGKGSGMVVDGADGAGKGSGMAVDGADGA